MALPQQATPRGQNHEGPALDDGQEMIVSNTDNEWDEERLEKALDTLKEMHIQVSQSELRFTINQLKLSQLRGLRTTIPRLITPLTTKQPSPEVLFQAFSNSVQTANQEVQEFRVLMNSEECKKVMEHARKSRAENPHGIKPWKVSDDPNWLKRET